MNLDFYKLNKSVDDKGNVKLSPDFQVVECRDLMIRGGRFYGIWDKDAGLWSTKETDAVKMIDADLYAQLDELKELNPYARKIQVNTMRDYGSNSYSKFKRYMKDVETMYTQLDDNLTFASEETEREDYASKRLSYDLHDGPCDAWNEIIGTLYTPDERAKLEWAIGSIVAGDSKKIQKFLVLYGAPGTGKGTILNIIQELFDGYYTIFEANEITGRNNAHAIEVFKNNPLVAIQQDGDLSRIEDNAKLNSIVSHEEIVINEKHKALYSMKFNAFLFMGTNKPVKITDAKSGIIRRLIDVHPSGETIEFNRYVDLTNQVMFELGAIANHCLEVYKRMGKSYYNDYIPIDMMYKTDVFFNFVEDCYYTFKKENAVALKQAYTMYKEYCTDSNASYVLPMFKFREELKNYFTHFDERIRIDGVQQRSYYRGFLHTKFINTMKDPEIVEEVEHSWINLDTNKSILDEVCKDNPAQATNDDGIPFKKWSNATTTLKDLDTSELHYVKMDLQHIVIDFDIKDEEGNKSLELNIKEASKFPPTYCEVSKGGNGLHLHYIYEGDVELLSRLYSKDVEVKVFVGNSSLRRRLSRCNDLEISTISSGLPVKGEKVLNVEHVKNEQMLRHLIIKNLNKEIHHSTKPSIDFIAKLLEDAYDSKIPYDVQDMRQAVFEFAMKSSHQSDYCTNKVMDMKWTSDESIETEYIPYNDEEEKIVFYDVEVFPNLFVVDWKYQGSPTVQRMINPSAAEIGELLKRKLVGFNNRRYDNHILYGAYIGYNNEQLYRLSQKIINNVQGAMFLEAYNLSYTDIYDYSTKKQSLKKWEIELGIHHLELGLDWDDPVPEELWDKVAEYCENDVIATEAVFNATQGDYIGRLIISALADLPPCSTTQKIAARIIFGKNKNPQSEFVYTDLSEEFPGYKYSYGKSTYRGREPGEGGYVWSKPGMHGNVGLFDIASQHPTTGQILNIFGPYTKNYVMLKDARLEVKHNFMEKAIEMLADILSRSRNMTMEEAKNVIHSILDEFDVNNKTLSYALKIVINIVYGMSSAKFPNPFKDPRNVDNIMAKRGALFMIDLLEECLARGIDVVHIKTDSIKIADYTEEQKQFVIEFGAKYGYTFEHEATYEKMCLVNDAVYIAKYGWSEDEEDIGKWTATGAQFQHPYVFKKLFSGEVITVKDMSEAKSVTSKMYADFNETLIDMRYFEIVKELKKLATLINKYEKLDHIPSFEEKAEYETNCHKYEELSIEEEPYHDYHFIGKVGSFIPVKEGRNGAWLMREKDGKYHSVTGTKGHRWMESETFDLTMSVDDVDLTYHERLIDSALKNISQYVDPEWFRSDEPYIKGHMAIVPF